MTDKRIKSYLKDRLKRLEDIKNKREWTTAELGDITCCKQTLAFINSLQEEPDPYIQYASREAGIKAHAEDYSFNIESELFQQLTTDQQNLWRKEIEQAVISGGYCGLNLSRDKRYDKEEPVSEDEIEKSFSAGDVVVYVSRHPAYSGLYLLGNPNDLSIGYSNANEPYQIYLRNCTIASEDERKQFMRELNLNGYKWNENTLRIEKIEKPVSEDLEEAVNTYIGYPPEVDECSSVYGKRQAFKAGAQWKEKRIIEKVCEWIEETNRYFAPTNFNVENFKAYLKNYC